MGIFNSVWRFITTLGGLVSRNIDDASDSISTTPQGIRAAYKETRDRWSSQYKDIRDSVASLMTVIEARQQEIHQLSEDREQLELRKAGAVEKFRETNDAKYQTAFQEYHTKLGKVQTRLEELNEEVESLNRQVSGYKTKLEEMQKRIKDLDKQESQAIADIVSSRQIVALNDRLANLSTSLQDENLRAIEKARLQARAKAKLSDELSSNDSEKIEQEVIKAGMTTAANDEFNRLLADAELRNKERPQATSRDTERSI